ncbi:carboxypeptidase-like regulatory domain-containing protein [Hymenobacter sedentarius]|uniref:carboxypeptidase-like regulatory domain-containing protein n=1 Tax=Hymenobacter sedentarius TaxID=1411621 RepID=UPI0009E7E8BD|nr:carboxypeptidase-like regulatory domain-containing protein [Hymenobacter sedentarius]
MRLLFLAAAFAVCGALPAAAQRGSTASTSKSGNSRDRIALATRPNAAAERPLRLACAPISGKVFDPNGQPLVGATLLIKGTQDVYVTDSEGKFRFTEPVYEGQVLAIEAAGYKTLNVPLADCAVPRLVLERAPSAHIKRSGKRAGQVTRLHNRNTNLK